MEVLVEPPVGGLARPFDLVELFFVPFQGFFQWPHQLADRLLPVLQFSFRFSVQGLERAFRQLDERLVVGFQRLTRQGLKDLGQLLLRVGQLRSLALQILGCFVAPGFGHGACPMRLHQLDSESRRLGALLFELLV